MVVQSVPGAKTIHTNCSKLCVSLGGVFSGEQLRIQLCNLISVDWTP